MRLPPNSATATPEEQERSRAEAEIEGREMGGGRGRGKKSRTQRKHFHERRDNVWKRSNNTNADNPTWQPFATQNPAFDEYYKEQGIVSPDEWDTFVEVLRTPLPAAFRINSSSQFCEDIRLQLENDFMKSLQAETNEGSEVEAIRPLAWYPDNLAWHSNFSRMQLRKNQTLERFHEFLKLENEIGNITRQEAVSMVPPLFLDVRPYHFILDMCAAPGSKTFQLLEIIYQSAKAGILPDGMVIANDLDVQRCNLLIHQTKRMCTANLIVTNNEAQQFPSCRSNRGSSGAPKMEFEPPISQLLFDRVLCDVPCSGDGTLRKAPDLWRKWNSGMGNGLHSLQIQIAMRGVSVLEVGGRMVYSTCSMNPVENEAVVAEVLRKCAGSVELIDASSELPQLVRRPGLTRWKVCDKGIWLSSHRDVSKYHRYGILPSMFPSGKSYGSQTENGHKDESGGGNIISDDGVQRIEEPIILTEDNVDEVSDLPLERCMRIVPHDQNSGAFFIAVLQKVSRLPAIQERPSMRGRSNNKRCEAQDNLIGEAVEDNKELELSFEAATVENPSGAVSESDLIGYETEKAVLESDPDNTFDETDMGEAQEKANGETDCGKLLGKRKLQIQGRWKGVDPVIFFKDDVIINSIKTFYGIQESFPLEGHLISRNIDNNHVKRIYYISTSVKDALELNFLAGQQLKIASVGLKMFERQSSREGTSAPCAFRISSEGLPVILPHITKQILHASAADFMHLLQYKAIKFGDFVDPEFGDMASKLIMGCCVIVLKHIKICSEPTKVDASAIAIGCWKGRSSLSVMVTAIDCQELLERLSARMEATASLLQGKDTEADELHRAVGIDKIEESETCVLSTVDG